MSDSFLSLEILLLFASLIASLAFSYIAIRVAEKIAATKKLSTEKRVLLFMYTFGAMAIAFVATFLFAPLGVIVLWLAMYIGAHFIAAMSHKIAALFAVIYTVIFVALLLVESYLVNQLLLTK